MTRSTTIRPWDALDRLPLVGGLLVDTLDLMTALPQAMGLAALRGADEGPLDPDAPQTPADADPTAPSEDRPRNPHRRAA